MSFQKILQSQSYEALTTYLLKTLSLYAIERAQDSSYVKASHVDQGLGALVQDKKIMAKIQKQAEDDSEIDYCFFPCVTFDRSAQHLIGAYTEYIVRRAYAKHKTDAKQGIKKDKDLSKFLSHLLFPSSKRKN